MTVLERAPRTSADPSQPPAAGGRRDDIQGLRALAVLAVVIFHAGRWLPGGFVGVDVFFVISGFVITAMLRREYAAQGRIRFARFYLRRFKRLTPALAVVVTVTMIGAALLLAPVGPQESAAKTGIGAMFLLANIIIAHTTGGYFGQSAEVNPLLDTWSLAVEEQFYLVFPALLAAGWMVARRSRAHRHAPTVLVAVAGAISFALALSDAAGWSVPFMPDVLVGFYGPVTRVWEFAAGALLALGFSRLHPSRRSATVVGLTGAVGLVASLTLITSEATFPGPWTILPVAATCLLIAAGSTNNPVSKVFSVRPVVAVGDLSYSLYLWHWPLIVFAGLLWPGSPAALVIAALVSVFPAWVSYRFVEQPIRRQQFSRVQLGRLVVTVVAVPATLSSAVLVAAQQGYWHPTVQRYQEGIRASHAGFAAGCTASAWQHPADCTSNAEAPGTPIYLLGDSNADQFREAIDGAGRSLGRPVVGLTEDGCAYLRTMDAAVANGAADDRRAKRCSAYPAPTADYLRTAPRGTVVIANAYSGWREGNLPAAPEAAAGRLVALRSDLSATVSELQRSGHQVVLVQPVPHWGDTKGALSWAGCSVIHMLTDGCARSMPLSKALAPASGPRAVISNVAAETGAKVVDVGDKICPDHTCQTATDGGMVRYRDGTHISVPQSRALVGSFTAALADTGSRGGR